MTSRLAARIFGQLKLNQVTHLVEVKAGCYVLTEEDVLTLIGVAATTPAEDWPEQMPESLQDILGRPNFSFIQLAQLYRAAGRDLKCKAEIEQAVIMYDMLRMWVKHGEGWHEAYTKIIDGLVTKAKMDAGL